MLPGLEMEAGVVHVASLVLLAPPLYLLLVDRPVRPGAHSSYGSYWARRLGSARQARGGRGSREEQEEREEIRVVEKRMRLRMREGLARFSLVVSVERPTRVPGTSRRGRLQRVHGLWRAPGTG